jgi:hypothetical protein
MPPPQLNASSPTPSRRCRTSTRWSNVLAAAHSTLAASSENHVSKLAATLAGVPVVAFYMKTMTSSHKCSMTWKNLIVSSTFLMWRNFKMNGTIIILSEQVIEKLEEMEKKQEKNNAKN